MDSAQISVLYLDDEENNLKSFKATFRRDFKIFITSNPQEAVQILNDEEIHVIISDQKMPDLSGVEFFELIIPDFPEPIRMLLTGYSDIEAVIDAVNKGQIYRYITKPWNEQELKITIENAFEIYDSRQKLKDKNQALEKAYNELEKFVYSASHDLRAPLVSILGVIKMAKAENDEFSNHKYLEMIESSTTKLDQFVTDIIKYYQNLKQGITSSTIDFEAMVNDVINSHQHFDGASEIDFKTNVRQSSDFQSDELRLRLILNNLISNAIKYKDKNKKPSVEILIEVNNEMADISVSDNGIGISRTNLPKVFDMFYRSADSTYGSGIGLYIAKEAVEKLDGKIEVNSEPGRGTKFHIEIPNHNG